MKKIESVGVFCSATFSDKKSLYYKEAQKLGKLLGQKKLKVVYGGSETGIMGAVAQSALDNGSNVLGITTSNVIDLEDPLEGTDIEIVCSLQERKQIIIEKSDVFVGLGGGIGTINELFDILVGHQIAEHVKPLILVNTKKFYNPFINYLNFLTSEGFVSELTLQRLKIVMVKNADEAMKIILKLRKREKENAKKVCVRQTIKAKK